MQESKELNISDILSLFLKKIKLIISCAFLGFILLLVVSKYLIEPRYTSSISLYVNNKESTANTALNINDIAASQKLVNTYIVILKDDEVLNKVADQLMQEYSLDNLDEYIGLIEVNGKKFLKSESLSKVLVMSAVDNTEILKIKAETKDANFSARVCTIIAEKAPNVLQRIVKAGSVEVIGPAEPAYKESSPNIKINCIIGMLLGLVLSAGYVLSRFLLDNTIKGEEDIKDILDIPVLGEIPDMNSF